MVEIVEVITGTKLVRMTFDRKVAVAGLGVGVASLAVAVLALGADVAGRIQQQPSGRPPESVARMFVDNGVVRCVITTSEGQIMIGRDAMPAVTRLRDRRNAVAIEDFGDELEIAQDMPRLRPTKHALADLAKPTRSRVLEDGVVALPGKRGAAAFTRWWEASSRRMLVRANGASRVSPALSIWRRR